MNGFRLFQNYPNPFNPETVISFYLPRSTMVELAIFDVHGREVTTLLRENKSAGFHRMIWNGRTSTGRAVASGIYVCRLTAGTILRQPENVSDSLMREF